VAHLLKESIRYALEHRREALEYALRYARDLDSAQPTGSWYVRERTHAGLWGGRTARGYSAARPGLRGPDHSLPCKGGLRQLTKTLCPV